MRPHWHVAPASGALYAAAMTPHATNRCTHLVRAQHQCQAPMLPPHKQISRRVQRRPPRLHCACRYRALGSHSPSRAAIMPLPLTLARGHHVPPAPPKGAGAAPKAADARRLRNPKGANGRIPLELQCDGLALRSIPQQLLGRVVEAVASHTARGDGGTRGTCSGHKAAHTTQSHPTWDVCASHKAQGGDCCSHG